MHVSTRKGSRQPLRLGNFPFSLNTSLFFFPAIVCIRSFPFLPKIPPRTKLRVFSLLGFAHDSEFRNRNCFWRHSSDLFKRLANFTRNVKCVAHPPPCDSQLYEESSAKALPLVACVSPHWFNHKGGGGGFLLPTTGMSHHTHRFVCLRNPTFTVFPSVFPSRVATKSSVSISVSFNVFQGSVLLRKELVLCCYREKRILLMEYFCNFIWPLLSDTSAEWAQQNRIIPSFY